VTERVALYTRVSMEDQAKEGFSLKAQENKLRDYARAQEWQVVAAYVDEDFSGSSTKRPAYQRMMAERDLWDRVLVTRIDRVHQDYGSFLELVNDLDRWGKQLTSVEEPFDRKTAMGRFTRDLAARIAQLEREQKEERATEGVNR